MAATGYLVGVSCAGALSCTAVGTGGNFDNGALLHSPDGGATWAAQATTVLTSSLDGIDCTSPTTCVASGADDSGFGAILATTNGGSTWTLETLPGGTGPFISVTCGTATDCFAIGIGSAGSTLEVTADGGATWTTKSVPESDGYIEDLTCTSATDCVGVGLERDCPVHRPDDRGRSHHHDRRGVDLDSPGRPGRHRPASRRQLLVDDDVRGGGSEHRFHDRSRDRHHRRRYDLGTPGHPLQQRAPHRGELSLGRELRGGGRQRRNALQQINAEILATTDGGATWVAQVAPSSAAQLARVTCPSVTSCLAVGIGVSRTNPFAPAIATTSDGGATWQSATLPSDAGELAGLACVPTTTICFASGISLDAIGGGGGGLALGLGAETPIAVAGSGASASASASASAAVRRHRRAVGIPPPVPCERARRRGRCDSRIRRASPCRDDPARQGDPEPGHLRRRVPCRRRRRHDHDVRSAIASTGGGGQIFASGDGGSTWTEQVVPAQTALVASLACPSPAACFGAGADVYGRRPDPVGWHSPPPPPRPRRPRRCRPRRPGYDDLDGCATTTSRWATTTTVAPTTTTSTVAATTTTDNYVASARQPRRTAAATTTTTTTAPPPPPPPPPRQSDDDDFQGGHRSRLGELIAIGVSGQPGSGIGRRIDTGGLESFSGLHRPGRGRGAHRSARRLCSSSSGWCCWCS